MSAPLREQVAKSLAAPLQGRYANDPEWVWDSLILPSMQERFRDLSGSALAVVRDAALADLLGDEGA